MKRVLCILLFVLLGVFCVAYPIGVIGVAFDVQPSFSLVWAGSALLFLQGALVIVAMMLVYEWSRVLVAGGSVVVLSYAVEAIGVGTGFPFGAYRYTEKLVPGLPGGVPLPVMFAWVLIIFGSYAIVKRWPGVKRGREGGTALLLGALLATLLDLAIEPVAAHVVGYWEWLAPGGVNYYGVPLANFVAWFGVAFALLWLVAIVLGRREELPGRDNVGRIDAVQMKVGMVRRLAVLVPRLLFAASLLMFGLVDVTHGYWGGVVCAVVAGGVMVVMVEAGRRWGTLG